MICRYEAPCGALRIVVENATLRECKWIAALSGYDRLLHQGNHDDKDDEIMKTALGQLDEYFNGGRHSFHLPIGIEGTPFRMKIWNALTEIPYGEVVTYTELASRCGCPGAQRAVAQACGSNPIAIIIPCHRVIAANGTLGGYTITDSGRKKGSTEQGLSKKSFLLSHEYAHSPHDLFTTSPLML